MARPDLNRRLLRATLTLIRQKTNGDATGADMTGAAGFGCGLFIAVAITGSFVALQQDAERNQALNSSTDPAEIARLVLHEEKANSSARIEGDRFVMTYSLAPWSLTSGTAISTSNLHMKQLTPLIFERFPNVIRVEVSATGEFSDTRGNSFDENAIRFVFTRRNAATIRWDKIFSSDMPKLADQYWVHPGLTNLIILSALALDPLRRPLALGGVAPVSVEIEREKLPTLSL